jgi:hypothetical protein
MISPPTMMSPLVCGIFLVAREILALTLLQKKRSSVLSSHSPHGLSVNVDFNLVYLPDRHHARYNHQESSRLLSHIVKNVQVDQLLQLPQSPTDHDLSCQRTISRRIDLHLSI